MTYAMDTYNQYRDLPQIPFQSDPQSTTWSDESQMSYQHGLTTANNVYYLQRGNNDYMHIQTMQRFLGDATPLTSGLLHANLNHGIHHQARTLSPYPTPEYARHHSPDETSTSGNSSYATGNEARSPRPYPIGSYGSPRDYLPSSSPYHVLEHVKQESYPHELAQGGGSVTMRELELYNHQPEPEPEPTIEEHDVETKMELDGTYEADPDYTRIDSGIEGYKESSDSAVSHSLRDAESVQPMDPSEGESSDADYTPRSTRRRRSSASTSSSKGQSQRRRPASGRKGSSVATASTGRVTKRGGRGPSKMSSETFVVDSQRHFPCPLTMYGCVSTFSSKNEWKRHVSTQHIKLGFWRCDLCATTVDPHDQEVVYHNDFNRKDLFTQHLRRMHAAPPNQSHRSQKEYPVNEDNIADHQKRCFQVLRGTPTKSSCLYCDETFSGPTSWENRMEHIGRHLEKDRKAGSVIGHVATWNIDKAHERWLIDEGIIALDKVGNWKIGDGRPRRRDVSDEDTSEDE